MVAEIEAEGAAAARVPPPVTTGAGGIASRRHLTEQERASARKGPPTPAPAGGVIPPGLAGEDQTGARRSSQRCGAATRRRSTRSADQGDLPHSQRDCRDQAGALLKKK